MQKKYIENIFLVHCKVIYVLLQQKLNFVFEVVFSSDILICTLHGGVYNQEYYENVILVWLWSIWFGFQFKYILIYAGAVYD